MAPLGWFPSSNTSYESDKHITIKIHTIRFIMSNQLAPYASILKSSMWFLYSNSSHIIRQKSSVTTGSISANSCTCEIDRPSHYLPLELCPQEGLILMGYANLYTSIFWLYFFIPAPIAHGAHPILFKWARKLGKWAATKKYSLR